MSDAFSAKEKAEWLAYDQTFTHELEHESDEPETRRDAWGTYGVHQLVGNGVVTNPENAEGNNPKACGRYYGNNGCVHTEFHDVTTLDGVNHKGMAFVSKRFRYCDKPTCPICYSHWAWRESVRIEIIIKEASKKQGKAEHVISSVPSADYHLSFAALYKKNLEVLADRGVQGGCIIFHAFRKRDYDKVVDGVLLPKGWFWSPHWHIVGFLTEGYGKCRGCSNCCGGRVRDTVRCLGCDGFEGKTRRCYDKEGGRAGSGYIVKVADGKVKGERITVQGTAWYQLTHCSIRTDAPKSHAVTWFGTCSRNKLKLTKERIKGLREHRKCPICGTELVPLRYMGFDMARIQREFWVKHWEEPAFDKDGLPVWVEKT